MLRGRPPEWPLFPRAPAEGQDEEAKARLDEIIRDFPGTPSAEEAKRLRTDLGK